MENTGHHIVQNVNLLKFDINGLLFLIPLILSIVMFVVVVKLEEKSDAFFTAPDKLISRKIAKMALIFYYLCIILFSMVSIWLMMKK